MEAGTPLLEIVSDPEWELEDLVDIINLDPALTGRLLRIANSAASASQTRIQTVEDAAMRLGAGQVVSLAVAAAVRDHMNDSMPEYGAAAGELWRHSVAAALAADCIPRVTRTKVPPEAYTAALLHDVGKLTLARHLGGDALQMLKRAEEEGGLSQVLSESELLEVNHGELGGLIAQNWKLPGTIVHGIIFHHDPSNAGGYNGNSRVCDVVYLADVVAKEIGEGMGQAPPPREIHRVVRDRLGLDDAGYEELCDRVITRFDETLSWYG